MISRKPITIVGGGLSGLALGIGLRQAGIPVTVWEAGDYPRQRVCGEFISGRGLDCLEAIGLKEALRDHSIPTETVSFFSTSLQFGPVKLPRPGLSVSRWVLDHKMSQQFSSLGGELKTKQRWREDFEKPGVVRSTGRRIAQSSNGKFFGVKVHAKNISLSAGLEMHFTSSGYVGLCALNSTGVNICGLFRSREDFKGPDGSWRQWLAGEPGSPLQSRMAQGELEMDSFCSVAALPMEISWPIRPSECRIGDAINMMPPVTGNGMSMALESAVIARGPLEQYSAGNIDWLECLKKVALANHRAFAFRLRAAGWLHRLLFHPSGRVLVFNSARLSPRCFSALFALTR